MADRKISELSALTGANSADDDLLVIVDTSADETKKITLGELENALAERDFSFGDNDKLVFGAGSDLQIYHDGTHSYIDDVGTGRLNIRANDRLYLRDTNDSVYAVFYSGAGSFINHNGNTKLATTSTGIDVTGTVTADGLTVDGDATISSASPTLNLTDTGGVGTATINANLSNVYYTTPSSSRGHYFKTNAGSNDVLSITGGGDISFYEDTGTTPKFFWDASAEGLSLGHTGNTSILDVLQSDNITDVADVNSGAKFGRVNSSGNGQTSGLFLLASGNGGSNNGWAGMSVVQPNANSNNADLTFITRGSSIAERMRIDSSGNVGIGTASPTNHNPNATTLHVDGGAYASEVRLTNNTTGAASGNGFHLGSIGTGAYIWQNEAAPLILATSSTEAMRIDSSGNVGIGTSSIDYTAAGRTVVHVEGSAGALLAMEDTGARSYFFQSGNDLLLENDTASGSMIFGTNSSTERMRIDSSGQVSIGTTSAASGAQLTLGGGSRLAASSGNGLNLATGGSDRLHIDSSGNVGIGTSSPLKSLELGALDVFRMQTGSVTMDCTPTAGAVDSFIWNTSADAIYRWDMNGNERMRIDSSGNLLVGTTSTTPAVSNDSDGIALQANGTVQFSANATTTAIINRKATDGAILQFRKDGTTVGSIGVNGSRPHFTHPTYGGLRVDDYRVNPATTAGANWDNSLDLGAGGTRWKDLYLSGGVYLGGTGAANKLDDYEEGTWTPQLLINNSSSGIAYNGRDGSYTKVGRLVTLMGYVHLSSKGTTAGGVSIAGLPFTTGDSLGTTSFNGTGTFWFDNMASAKSNLICWVDDLNAEMYLRHTAGSGSTVYQNTAASDITDTFDIRFVVHYFTA